MRKLVADKKREERKCNIKGINWENKDKKGQGMNSKIYKRKNKDRYRGYQLEDEQTSSDR